MVNRVLQVKVLKIKRRRMKQQGRFDQKQISSDRHSISLSKQLINVGLRVPGVAIPKPAYAKEQIKEFLRPRSWVEDDWEYIPRTLGLQIGRELALKLGKLLSISQDLSMQNCILRTQTVRVYCFFDIRMKDIYLVRVDLKKCIVQRSVCNYPDVNRAQQSAIRGLVVWRRPSSSTD